MKKIYSSLLVLITSLTVQVASAQVSSYLFAQSNSTYVPITGGTVVATATSNTAPGNLASTVWNLPNGSFFPFTFNGQVYTGCNISCHGYITFGTLTPVATAGSPINNTTLYDGCVSAWGRTNNGVFQYTAAATGTLQYTSELRVEELGTAPNRTFVIQYDNWRYSSGTTATTWLHDWQIRLVETFNIIEVVYGEGVMAGGNLSTSGFNCQVGLRGASNLDFNNRSSFGLFDASTTGTINTASQAIGVSNGVGIFMPPNGLKYRWFPPCKMGATVSPSITVNKNFLCEGDTVNFSASNQTPFVDINYQWKVGTTPGGPYTSVNGTTFAGYQTVPSPGTYFFILVSTCSSVPTFSVSNEIQVDVRPNPILGILASPALNTTVSPIETCFGETYTFVATGADTYTWTNGPTTSSYVVQPFSDPVYTVTGTSVDGCISTQTIAIQVNPLPVINISTSPSTAICPGEQIVIGASGGALSYTWAAPSSTAFMITVSPTVTTIYTVYATAPNGCTNIAAHPIFVRNVVQLTASSSDGGAGICKGESASLHVVGAFSYTWTNASSYTAAPVVTVSPLATTNYTVMSLDTNGCVNQATLSLKVSACTGLNESSGSLAQINVQPNPNNGVFTVELNNGASKIYELLDMSGRIVLSEATNAERTEIRMNDMAAGVYYLRVYSNSDIQILKVIKQ